jgi:hypothetical protein
MKKKMIFTLAFTALAALLYGQSAGDFVVQGRVLTKYRGTATTVIIPANLGITEIGKSAFEDAKITLAVIPAGVTSIGDSAFAFCDSLIGIIIPNSVTSIGRASFNHCKSLTGIIIPAGVTSIGDWAFASCGSLTGITIPNSVTSIGESAFWYCTSLTGVTIPNSVTSIGEDAFFGCTSLSSITIPNSITFIGRGAFSACGSLTGITVAERNKAYTSVDGVLFNKTKTTLVQYPAGKQGKNYTIPNSVTSIGNNAFWDCTSLRGILLICYVRLFQNFSF